MGQTRGTARSLAGTHLMAAQAGSAERRSQTAPPQAAQADSAPWRAAAEAATVPPGPQQDCRRRAHPEAVCAACLQWDAHRARMHAMSSLAGSARRRGRRTSHRLSAQLRQRCWGAAWCVAECRRCGGARRRTTGASDAAAAPSEAAGIWAERSGTHLRQRMSRRRRSLPPAAMRQLITASAVQALATGAA